METRPEIAHTTKGNQSLPFQEVNIPGCYVANETGDLFRIPQDALVAGRSPTMEIVCRTPKMVTKISNDPWEPISKARQLAADDDLYVGF